MHLMFSLSVRRLQMMLCICRTQHVYKILQVHVLCALCGFFRTEQGYSSQCQCIPMNIYANAKLRTRRASRSNLVTCQMTQLQPIAPQSKGPFTFPKQACLLPLVQKVLPSTYGNSSKAETPERAAFVSP